jgi:hypothetical protein
MYYHTYLFWSLCSGGWRATLLSFPSFCLTNFILISSEDSSFVMCSRVRFWGICCTHLRSLSLDGGSVFLRNVGVIYRSTWCHIPFVRTKYLNRNDGCSGFTAVRLVRAHCTPAPWELATCVSCTLQSTVSASSIHKCSALSKSTYWYIGWATTFLWSCQYFEKIFFFLTVMWPCT